MKTEKRHPKWGEFLYACCASPGRAKYLLRTYPELLENNEFAGETPLHYLAIEDRVEAVEFLIQCGAKVDTTCCSGATPLIHAAGLGLREMVVTLLTAGADPNSRNNIDGSALHRAAGTKEYGVEIMKLLLDAGGQIEIADDFGDTPLMAAVKAGRGDVVRLLLERGASANARNHWGETVLHVAGDSEACGAAVVELLLAAGAAPHAIDRFGETPLQTAIVRGKLAVADVLENA